MSEPIYKWVTIRGRPIRITTTKEKEKMRTAKKIAALSGIMIGTALIGGAAVRGAMKKGFIKGKKGSPIVANRLKSESGENLADLARKATEAVRQRVQEEAKKL